MISEAWEYWVPDPEVAAALCGYDPREEYESLLDGHARAADRGTNPGVRFGRGDPDGFWPRGGVWRVDHLPASRWAVCGGCGGHFERDRRGRAYCSLRCRPAGRAAPRESACAHCRRPFRPLYAAQLYCRRACLAAAQSAARRGVSVRVDRAAVLAMYAAGEPLAAICRACGCTRNAVQKIARAAGVPRRASGYHGRTMTA